MKQIEEFLSKKGFVIFHDGAVMAAEHPLHPGLYINVEESKLSVSYGKIQFERSYASSEGAIGIIFACLAGKKILSQGADLAKEYFRKELGQFLDGK